MYLKKKFISNLSFAFTAQFIAMLISLATNLILPKFLGVENYSYWQLFIFYSQYIPFLHLGINDGAYLRYGGIPYANMEKGKIKMQLLMGLFYQLVFCIILCFTSLFIVENQNRYIIIILACIYFLFYTIQNYLGYIFQAANETSWYSKSIILNRVIFLVAMLLFICGKKDECWPYIIGYIVAQTGAVLYTCIKGKAIIFAPLISFETGFREVKESVKAGIQLMLANIASMLILGSGRQIIDIKWGLTTFGKISFSITLTNFILTFIQQVGMVLFPMLRRLKQDKQKQIFEFCRMGMFFILPIVFIGYFPIKAILIRWLPDYYDSLQFLALMLPICFFDTKMQMLYSTYLKVGRKEKLLFKINLVSMLSSFFIGMTGAYILQSLNLVVIGMVFAIALRSAIAEFYLSRQILNIKFHYIQEIALVIIFMLSAWSMKSIYGFSVLFISYLLLLIINRKSLQKWFMTLLSCKNKQNRE